MKKIYQCLLMSLLFSCAAFAQQFYQITPPLDPTVFTTRQYCYSNSPTAYYDEDNKGSIGYYFYNPGPVESNEYNYYRSMFKFDLSTIPSNAIIVNATITVRCTTYQSSMSTTQAKIYLLPKAINPTGCDQDQTCLETRFYNTNTGKQIGTPKYSDTLDIDVTDSLKSRLTDRYIAIGGISANEYGGTPAIVKMKLKVKYYIPFSVTARNNFTGGTMGIVAPGINDTNANVPYTKTDTKLADAFTLTAKAQTDSTGYFRVWNNYAPDARSTWIQQPPSGSPVWKGNSVSINFNADSTDASATYTANLRKICNISRNDQTEFDGTQSVGVVAQIVEQNEGSISAPLQKDVNGRDYRFYSWSDGVTTNPRTYTPTDHTTLTAQYKAHLGSSVSTATTGSTGTYGNNQRKIAYDMNGVQYVVYSSAGSIWFSSNSDNYLGTNNGWTGEVKLGDGRNPSIAVTVTQYDSTTGVHVVWEQDLGSGSKQIIYRRSTNNGTSWEMAINSSELSLSNDATPVVFGNSYPAVVWRGADGLYECSNPPSHGPLNGLVNNKLLYTDATSQLPSGVEDWRFFAFPPSSSRPIYHLFYTNGNSIYYIRFQIEPSNFNYYAYQESPVLVSAAGTTLNTNPSCAIPVYSGISNDSVAVAWENAGIHKVYYRALNSYYVTFGGTQGVTNNTNLSKPSVCFDENTGNPIVLFQSGTNVGESIFDGTQWMPMRNLGSGTGPQFPIYIRAIGYSSISPTAVWTTGGAAPYRINVATLVTNSDEWSGIHLVQGDVTVDSGATLTIDPGTIVLFANGAKLTVNGTLIANGTSSQRITFDRNGSSGTWGGIIYNSGSSGSINYCNIRNATTGVNCSGYLPTITYCTISNNSTGIKVYLNGTSQNHIAYDTIQNNTSCGISTSYSSFFCDHNIINNNGTYGINCTNMSSPNLSPVLYNNTISNHSIGLNCYTSSTYLAIVDLNHQGYPGPGRNVITGNGYGISAVYGSNIWLGDVYVNGSGYNSIFNNTNYGLNAYNDGLIYAQNNWWNGTPSITGNSTVRYSPWLSSNPNPLVNNAPTGTPVTVNGGVLLKTTSNSSATPIQVNENTLCDDLLSQAQVSEYEGKSDEAIAKYRQIFYSEGNTLIGRYALRKLNECYRKSNKKLEFDEYVNTSVRTKISKNDELSALLIEFENQTMFENKNYDGVIKNLTGMLKDYKNIEPIYKQALFNLGLVYLQTLNDRSQATKYFSKLTAKYPDDLLVANAQYLLGEDLKEGGLIKYTEEENESTLTQNEIPTEFGLSNNYPNPFNPSTVINFQLPDVGTRFIVSLKVYDMLGREVATLANGIKDAGYYTATFDASRLASGVYFTRFVAAPQDGSKPYIQVRKIMLVK